MLSKQPGLIFLLIFSLFCSACSSVRPRAGTPSSAHAETEASAEIPGDPEFVQTPLPLPAGFKPAPYVMREFRAAWIATVANINWPSKSGLSSLEQQREAVALLDFLQKHHYNAVILQVRPQGDAFYPSELEPWSYFLTGEAGKAPEPYYDPLQFWLDKAHDRGLELHVWLNPYRAHHSAGGKVTAESMVKKRPGLMVELKNGMWWMDPSKEATQDHTAAVVMDIVKRYDIDGVHFDDYFYPYASYNKGEDFPDAAEYANYKASGGKLLKDDWRRQSVNSFVERIYKEIKAEKPLVKFGISPFGIYRPGYPENIKGMDQYSELYADARLWLNKGWIDYYSPQLYWKINQPAQSFPVLLGWWENENSEQRHLWPGINIDFGGDDPNLIETISQIMITRGMLPESKGSIHWSIGPLLKYPKLSSGILEGAYKKQALVPSSPWLNAEIPAAPVAKIELDDDRIILEWEHETEEKIFQWVVHYRYNGSWNYRILNRNLRSLNLPRYLTSEEKGDLLTQIGISAIDRTGNQSSFVEVKL